MIHQYKNNGYNIVLDVNSGMVHCVDDIVYDVLPLFEEKSFEEILESLEDRYSENEIKEAYGEIAELKEQGVLFTDDVYEEHIKSNKKH